MLSNRLSAFSGSSSTSPRFSGQNTFLVPDNSHTVFVPGMFGPKHCVEPISDYFKTQGQQASVNAVVNPGVRKARSLRDSTDWMMDKVSELREEKLQTTLPPILQELKKAGKQPEEQRQAISRLFDIDSRTRLAQALTEATRQLLVKSSYPQYLLTAGSEGQPSLSQASRETREHLKYLTMKQLKQLESGHDVQESEEKVDKAVNRIMDTLTPRLVLVGHSLGGMVGTKALLENTGDVGMIITLGSPLNGTEKFPSAFHDLFEEMPKLFRTGYFETMRLYLDRTFPAIPQMRRGSQSVEDIQNTPLPFDTSAISLHSEEDGMVTPENAKHRYVDDKDSQVRDKHRGRLNMTISSREAKMAVFMGSLAEYLQNLTVVGRFTQKSLEQSPRYKGLRQHLGFLDNNTAYWADNGGELKQKIFEGPQSVQHLRNLLDEQNYEPLRLDVLQELLTRTSQPGKAGKQARQHYRKLQADLERIAQEPTPFKTGSDKLARKILRQLDAA